MNGSANSLEQVVLSAMLHDIGKFMQRFDFETRTTFTHEELSKHFIEGNTDINWPGLSKWLDESTCQLISFLVRTHHQKVLEKSGLGTETGEWWKACIVSEADNLASGEREAGDEVLLSPLSSIFSAISKETGEDKAGYHSYHPLGGEINQFTPRERDNVAGSYETHIKDFIGEFRELVEKAKGNAKIETLLNLLQKYLWCIPSAYYKSFPDISLFDHLKTSAAISAILWKHFGENSIEHTPEALRAERNKPHFSLICADLSGVQDFIYTLTPKGAAKNLKGRSFYLQLLGKAVSRFILHRFGLPVMNLLYSSGGRAYILSRNITEDEIETIEKDVNRFLLKKYNATLYVAIASTDVCGNDFSEKENFSRKWSDAGQKAGERKKRKFRAIILENYDDIFKPEEAEGIPSKCEVCGIDLKGEEKRCSTCHELEKLGEKLRSGNILVEKENSEENTSYGFQFGDFKISYEILKNSQEYSHLKDGAVRLYNINHSDDFLFNLLEKPNIETGYMFLGGTMPPKKGSEIKTFQNLADDSNGVKCLGILRMDVDNLGRTFAKGFGRNSTISRMTSLSFHLDFFFGCLINSIMDGVDVPMHPGSNTNGLGNMVYTIYSGGDDLFIVGAWDVMPFLAESIRKRFGEYTCEKLTLSAGISIVKGDYPIHRGATIAGEAEDEAKRFGENGNSKNAVSFLGRAVSWEQFESLRDIAYLLAEGISEGTIPRSFISRLERIHALYAKERKSLSATQIPINEVIRRASYNRWRWLMVYHLDRFKKRYAGFGDNIDKIRNFFGNNTWNNKTLPEAADIIEIPARWAELLTRKED